MRSTSVVAVATVIGLVATLVTSSSGVIPANAAPGDISVVAGGGPELGLVPTTLTPGTAAGFSVYATNVEAHAGKLYVRDYQYILEVDATTGLTRRVAGAGYAVPAPTPDDGLTATEVNIGWSRALAVGDDGSLYIDQFVGPEQGRQILRVDPDTGLLHRVAGDGSTGVSGDGGPAVDAGLGFAADLLSLDTTYVVDDQGDLWLDSWEWDGVDPASFAGGIRVVDAVTGTISTVYSFPPWDPDAVSFLESDWLGVSRSGDAYVRETTYDITTYESLSVRTVRITPGSAPSEVGGYHTACDPPLGTPLRHGHLWFSAGVRYQIFDVAGVWMLCSLDLQTGAATAEPLPPAMAAIVSDGRILEDALATAEDGTVSFVAWTSFVDELGQPSHTYPLNLYVWERSAPEAPEFVTRVGDRLTLAGQPYRFTGINMYDANNRAGCGTIMTSGSVLPDSLDEIGGERVIRAWFFQSLATNGGARDWSAFDRMLTLAAERGMKVMPTLGNQLADCEGANGGAGYYKTRSWYASGYRTAVDAGMVTTYRDWVAEIVDRYADDPTIVAWELVNEPEIYDSFAHWQAGTCNPGAGTVLHDFSADVSALVKSIDPNHLVSLGTIGSGQCGAANDDYSLVHSPPGIDVCSVHDYGSPAVAMSGDRWNGIAERIRQCRALGKPLFVGEAGIGASEVGGSNAARAAALAAKMDLEFRAGVVGYLTWAWQPVPTPGGYDIGPADPVLGVLGQSFPDDGGDSDADGITDAVDPITGPGGFDDGDGTSGVIVDSQSQYVLVLDAPAPDGIRVHLATAGSDLAPRLLSLCGVQVELLPGTDAVLTCGSIRVETLTGQVTVRLPGGATVTVPHGTTATIAWEPDGRFTVRDVVGAGVTITVSGTTTPISAGAGPSTFAAWHFSGFGPPVHDTRPNAVKAGSTVPLRWRLTDPSGRGVRSLTEAELLLAPCGSSQAPVAVATFTIGHGLHRHGRGRYGVEWKVPKGLKGTCQVLHLDLGEGTTHTATFLVR